MAYVQRIHISENEEDSDFSPIDCRQLFGVNDQYILVIENECHVNIAMNAGDIVVSGNENDVLIAVKGINKLIQLITRGDTIDKARIRYIINLIRSGKEDLIDEALKSVVAVTYKGKPVKCKTVGQQIYVNSIKEHDLTFAVGPAGTGKTYLAMALAVVALKNKEVERIVLTRPAVEAGEKLGFLPGDLTQKVDPYLRPLYDALYDFLGVDSYQKLIDKGVIEVAPLAYMRGRTLSNSFIILDEAQNSTCEQMKMFLTRFGFGSKVVVTGDLTQTDLPSGKKSGLAEAVEVLKTVPEIGIITLTHMDVVRHELVQKIVQAYENYYHPQS